MSEEEQKLYAIARIVLGWDTDGQMPKTPKGYVRDADAYVSAHTKWLEENGYAIVKRGEVPEWMEPAQSVRMTAPHFTDHFGKILYRLKDAL